MAMKQPIFPLALNRSIISVKRRIGQPVAVVGQKNLFILHKTLNRKKPLSDISPNARYQQA